MGGGGSGAVCMYKDRAGMASMPIGFVAPWEMKGFGSGVVEELVGRAQRHAANGMGQVFRILKVKGDGRCLFRSIAKNLALFGGRSLPERLEKQDADALREAAFKVICVDKREDFRKKGIIEGDIANYCTRMRNPDFYGGEPEMFVLAEVLQTPIGVYLQISHNKFQKLVMYGAQFAKKTKDEIRVLYNGTNHYDALI
ncbi:hypothetical protein NDN08_005666 [Rhodosorus marinus]|uniref:Ubiquitin thioesterase OTU n=1 Tax=Rhodosorus marinus TaxID=101924 RepID=A0AAV8V5F3_9RHOD|nr:hypothetical protein NDN08_005666 [Rhodosorus marinus]